MSPLSELDANLALPLGTRRRNLGRLLNREAREAEFLRVKTIEPNAASRPFGSAKTTDRQTSLDEASDPTPVKVQNHLIASNSCAHIFSGRDPRS